MKARKPAERKLFELTEAEREGLHEFIAKPPKRSIRIARLDLLISTITKRVAPFYQEGQGMANYDLQLIDRATGVLAEAEDAIEAARVRLKRSRKNLDYLYTGTGTPE